MLNAHAVYFYVMSDASKQAAVSCVGIREPPYYTEHNQPITSALKMDTARVSGTLASTNQFTWRINAKEHQQNRYHRADLKSDNQPVGWRCLCTVSIPV
jgi:hypothetical protein